MTRTLTPTTIGDQIVALPPDLANSIAQARIRFDAVKKAKEEKDDPEEDDESDDEEAAEDEEESPAKGSKMSFADKMAAAKAAKSAKKDSEDIEAIFARIDSLEAENKVLASLVSQDIHEDADPTMTDEDTVDMTPQEIALQLIDEFEEAKPFLPAEAKVTDYQDIYDIYENAIATRYPNALVNPDMEQEDDDDRINPMDADELRGAFLMMVIAANPMRMAPGMSMDSADESDRSFANALGLRSDGCDESTLPKTPKRTEYY